MTRLHAGVEGAAEVRQAHRRHPRHAEVARRHAELRARGDRQATRTPATICAIAAQRGAQPRRRGLAAATRRRRSASRSIDMTSFFCSATQCFPVVGGALVYKDVSHLTDVYASSLGPYLLRKIRALNGYWPGRPAPRPAPQAPD